MKTKRHVNQDGAALISLRINTHHWMNSFRRQELLKMLEKYRDTIKEIAFFTTSTGVPVQYRELAHGADILRQIIPDFKALGLRVGINHLSTLGHGDENLENALDEPWQKIVDINGTAAKACYCSLDPDFQSYTRECYKTLAGTGADFIWIDDDLRASNHDPAGFSCFCNLCLERFAVETGQYRTREKLAAAFDGQSQDSRKIRLAWISHNKRVLNDLFALIRSACDSTFPDILLGCMCIPMLQEGMAFAEWGNTLSGAKKLPVKWRPGGGFYTDEQPLGMIRKAHSAGRIAAAIPMADTDIQYELENFPYMTLKKSNTCVVAETCAAVAAGCTGTALNIMGFIHNPFEEFLPYFESLHVARPFLDKFVGLAGRSPTEGLWSAATPEVFSTFNACGEWAGSGGSDSIGCLTEFAEIGLPPAYSRAGSAVHLLSGDAVLAFSKDELRKLLSESAIIDGAALQHLHKLGLSELTGFEISGIRQCDKFERFTDAEINCGRAGWWRDCRGYDEAFLLQPLTEQAKILMELIDFTETKLGSTMGIFENKLGGRVAVTGYYPWTSFQTMAKTSQMKSLCLWLSRDRLPAWISSFHKMAIWCRRDSDGNPVVAIMNVSLDTATNATLMLRGQRSELSLLRCGGGHATVTASGRDGEYRIFTMPPIMPWEMAVLWVD